MHIIKGTQYTMASIKFFNTQKMTWQVVPVVLVLVVFVTNDYASAAGRLCGDRLTATLSLVCQGRGYYWDIEKRSERRVSGYDKPSSSSVKTKRSVVQECCHRTCSISELESYCQPLDAGVGPGSLLGSLSGFQSGPSSRADSLSSAAAAAAAAAASRQRFTQGLWLNKPFFFVTPRRTEGLIDAGEK